MKEDSIYSQLIVSKNGSTIPVLKNGKTIESRYDPQKESERFIQEQLDAATSFVIIFGIGGGALIQAALKQNPNLFIIAVEESQSDLDFLLQIELVKELKNNPKVRLCNSTELYNTILDNYMPAFYGNLKVIENRSWVNENKETAQKLTAIIQKAVPVVAADFSVQSHFGKLWMHNILSNLKTLDKTVAVPSFKNELNKTAVVFAAGPTLDSSIELVQKKPGDYFCIATDTAFSVLVSKNIIPQAVISLDGQYVSSSHFIHNSAQDEQFSDTVFLFDLSGNTSAVKGLIKNKNKVSCFISGHPLSTFVNQKYSLGLPQIYAGSGTVTIAAVDFAVKCGFTKINVLGADFAYVNSKPYAKGTYLDRLYNTASTRLNGSAKAFSTLQYRTPLTQTGNNSYTTDILTAYRFSFCEYLKNAGLEYSNTNDIYEIKNPSGAKQTFDNSEFNKKKVSGTNLINHIISDFKNHMQQNPELKTISDLTIEDISLLPLISWLRNNDNRKDGDFMYYYNKAAAYIQKF